MCCAVLVLVAAFIAVATVSAHSPPEAERSYKNSWAVEVDGGVSTADALAKAYGFVNKGPVGILKNVFRFDMPEQAYRKQGKKMNEPYLQVTDLLNSEKSVKFAEQQVVRRMVKKSYVAPTDPNWSQ